MTNMTNKEYIKHAFLLQTLNWLVKKCYGNILDEDKEGAVLIDVVKKLDKPMDDRYWEKHRFIGIPGLNGDQSTYFVFMI
jgi:hypothetical protein